MDVVARRWRELMADQAGSLCMEFLPRSDEQKLLCQTRCKESVEEFWVLDRSGDEATSPEGRNQGPMDESDGQFKSCHPHQHLQAIDRVAGVVTRSSWVL